MSRLSSGHRLSSVLRDPSRGLAESTAQVFYTNVPGPNEQIICGVNCSCSRTKKSASDKAVPGYDYIKYLGAGSFGAVHLYRSRRNKAEVAIKEVPYRMNGKDMYHMVVTEYAIVMDIQHPNITEYYDFFLNESRYKCYIVMEYMKRGTLRKLINDQNKKGVLLSQNAILRMIRGVISGVKYLNSHHVVHCDLKPDNILVADDGRLKICDFGTAHYVYDLDSTLAFTYSYMAPELFSGLRPDEKTEVWSTGIIFYELCTLKHPFQPFSNNAELIPKIKSGLFKSLNCRVSGYSYDMQELLEFMLQKNRENRKTFAAIMNHKLLSV